MEVHVAERFEATYRDINELHFVVIGAYVADCFVAAPRLPRWGEEYEVRSIRTSPGGKALNQAVAWHGWVLTSLRSGPSARTD